MIDFPASPTDGQIFSATNGVVYKYSATYTSWLAQNAAPPLGGTGDFSATNSAAQTGMPTNAAFAVHLDTILSGNSGLWYNTATGRYTPPAGRYFIVATFAGYTATGAASFTATLRKNGVAINSANPLLGTNTSANASYQMQPYVSCTVDANGVDYFEFWAVCSNSNGVLQSASFSAFPLTGMQGPTGPAGVTQTVFFETGALATGTTIIPFDDTIPQITEGDQYMTLAITPLSATSKLVIEVLLVAASSVVNNLIIALFQDATANALAVTTTTMPTGTSLVTGKLSHVMTSGTTSATTFRVRAGGNNAGTTTFNGNSGNRNFGGALASSIVIREVP